MKLRISNGYSRLVFVIETGVFTVRYEMRYVAQRGVEV